MADLRGGGSDDEHELGVEHTQEAGRTIALRNGEDMMSPASQGSREFGLRVSVNKQILIPPGTTASSVMATIWITRLRGGCAVAESLLSTRAGWSDSQGTLSLVQGCFEDPRPQCVLVHASGEPVVAR